MDSFSSPANHSSQVDVWTSAPEKSTFKSFLCRFLCVSASSSLAGGFLLKVNPVYLL